MATTMASSSSLIEPLASHVPPTSANAEKAYQQSHQQPTSITDITTSHRAARRTPALPSKNVLIFAADIYFRFCYNQPYSLFHEERFRQRLSAGDVPEYLVWAFLASSRRFSALPNHEIEGGDSVSALAKNAWDSFIVPWAGPANAEDALSIMQTTVLLVSVEHTGKLESLDLWHSNNTNSW